MPNSILKRLRKALRERGVRGTCWLAACFAWHALRVRCQFLLSLSPAARRRRARYAAWEREWDEQHNVDTEGLIPLSDLSVAGDRRSGRRYQAVTPEAFDRAVEAAGASAVAGRTFIDLGCGKGRAILLASRHPFRRCLGVEFARELAEVARQNLLRFRDSRQVCHDLDVIEGDAGDFPFPDAPLFVMLHNPFGGTVLDRVADNLRRSLDRNPRPVAVIYVGPELPEADVWASVPSLRLTYRGHGLRVYQDHFVSNVAFDRPLVAHTNGTPP